MPHELTNKQEWGIYHKTKHVKAISTTKPQSIFVRDTDIVPSSRSIVRKAFQPT